MNNLTTGSLWRPLPLPVDEFDGVSSSFWNNSIDNFGSSGTAAASKTPNNSTTNGGMFQNFPSPSFSKNGFESSNREPMSPLLKELHRSRSTPFGGEWSSKTNYEYPPPVFNSRNSCESKGFTRSNSSTFGADYNNKSYGERSPTSPGYDRGSPMKIGTWNSTTNSNTSPGNGSFPSVGTFEIGTFNSKGNDYRNGNNPSGPGIRETGIIEKLKQSYGFIQCCDRQARLFFHFSQFEGNIEHLKIGDPVEFEMTYDRRTGKPIASTVSKIASEVIMSDERVIGLVTTEAKIDPETGNSSQGRISYENRGECFFLPFTVADVEGNVTVTSGDKVSFLMATLQRSGNLVARTIRLENPSAPVKYKGVINSIKDNFGFIERADVVKEIFFHFSESQTGELNLGDCVEFVIQTRNNKEVACNITKLEPGSVVFVDIGAELHTGQVLKPIDRNALDRDTEALPGRVKFRAADRSEIEIPFGEKDQTGDFSLRHGDWVKFFIAVDRRDKLKRATCIEVLEESFLVSDERREQGVVDSVLDEFGTIICVDREGRIGFHFREILDVNKVPESGDEVEFTASNDNSGRFLAQRIKHLPTGTVKFEGIIHKNVVGKLIVPPNADTNARGEGSSGKISYELNGSQLEIPLHTKDCNLRRLSLQMDDSVVFDINQLKSTKETNAVNIRLVRDSNRDPIEYTPEVTVKKFGYITALKDGFGFIETIEMDKDVFFHYSNLDGRQDRLEVGIEVEYRIAVNSKDKKSSAEKVRVLPKGTLSSNMKVKSQEVFEGRVIRTMRSANPDQEWYSGLIAITLKDGTSVSEYQYGIASLVNKKEILQIRDPVKFNISSCGKFALGVQTTKEKLKASVEAVKGQFGFLNYEIDEGKKLFFHISEVEGGDCLQPGDEVEFVISTSKRTGKHSACAVKKISFAKRPDHLISRLKILSMEASAKGGPKLVVIRQPRGPDNTSGFKPRSILTDMARIDEMCSA